MTEGFPIEARIACDEGWASKRPKVNDDLFVLEPLRQQVVTDLPHRESGGFEQLPLAIEDVFVEDDQARTRSREYSAATYWPA